MERTRPKIIKIKSGIDEMNQPLFNSYFGCECCDRELDTGYKYCPECGRKIDWKHRGDYDDQSS